MAELEELDLGQTEYDEEKSGGSSGGSSRDYRNFADGVVDYLIMAITRNDGEKAFPVFDSMAREIPEGTREHFGITDDSVTHFSVESLSPYDIDGEYVGSPPTLSRDEYQTLVQEGEIEEGTLEADDFDTNGYSDDPRYVDEEFDRQLQTLLMKSLNGYHLEALQEAFSPKCQIKFAIAKQSTKGIEGPLEQRRVLRAQVSTSTYAPQRAKLAQYHVGECSQEDYNQWCEGNGFEDKKV